MKYKEELKQLTLNHRIGDMPTGFMNYFHSNSISDEQLALPLLILLCVCRSGYICEYHFFKHSHQQSEIGYQIGSTMFINLIMSTTGVRAIFTDMIQTLATNNSEVYKPYQG